MLACEGCVCEDASDMRSCKILVGEREGSWGNSTLGVW